MRRFFELGACFFLILFNAMFLYLFHIKGESEFHHENHLLENVQLVMLLAGAVVCAFMAVRFKTAGSVLVLSGFSLLSLNMLFREFEADMFQSAFLVELLDGSLRNIFFAVLWVAFAAAVLSQHYAVYHTLRKVMWSRAGVLIAVSAVCLLSSGLLEELDLQFYEELIEYNGYFFLLAGFYLSGRLLEEPGVEEELLLLPD